MDIYYIYIFNAMELEVRIFVYAVYIHFELVSLGSV